MSTATTATRTIHGVLVDDARGYDAMRGAKVMRHFATYEEAQAYACPKRGYYVRYWGVKSDNNK